MKFLVFHHSNLFSSNLSIEGYRLQHEGRLGLFPEDFECVALVECRDIEAVFHLTNHIDRPWWSNEEVLRVYAKGPRSTSVCDIAVDIESMEAYRCAPIGWRKMSVTTDFVKKEVNKYVNTID